MLHTPLHPISNIDALTTTNVATTAFAHPRNDIHPRKSLSSDEPPSKTRPIPARGHISATSAGPHTGHANGAIEQGDARGGQELQGGSVLGKRKAEDAVARADNADVASVHADEAAQAECDLYQTSEDLWDALSAKMKSFHDASTSTHTACPPLVTFRGAYSVVADPEVAQWRRVELVSRNLRRLAGLPHSSMAHSTRQHALGSWSQTYQCDCSRGRTGSSSPLPPSSPQAAIPVQMTVAALQSSQSVQSTFSQGSPTEPAATKPAKRTRQGKLSNWIVGASKKPWPSQATLALKDGGSTSTAQQALQTVPGCSGRLQITVQEEAHPLGYYKGHNITVVLEHPRSSPAERR